MKDEDLDIMINDALKEAELELSDNGKELNIVCDYKNGDDDTLSNYSKQIDKNEFTDEDIQRKDRLAKLCGISDNG